MNSFISDVLQNLIDKGEDLSDLSFILPSKRAGVFLRQELSVVVNKTIFSPKIISIEEFVENLAQLKSSTNTVLLFEFYNTYIELTPKNDQEPFETFSKWAQILLQDFNEIDRYLIPQGHIFDYLSAIKTLDHWSLEDNKTDVVKNYLKFWDKLKHYYKHYSEALIRKKIGYQGLIYREAVDKIKQYCVSNTQKHIFLGFNALNTAEGTIIQELLKNDLAYVFWDIDEVFINNPIHDAGLFTRQHKANWKYFNSNPFNWITNNYSTSKNIQIYGVPKNIGQAKTIGSILKEIVKLKPDLKNTAVILGDENLLIPVLNSIPSKIDNLNITMGFPLNSIPLASLFEQLFSLHKKTSNTYYYKDIIGLLSHQYISPLFVLDNRNYAIELIETIKKNNLVYLSLSDLKTYSKINNSILELVFSNWQNNAKIAIETCFKIIDFIKEHLFLDKKGIYYP